MNEYSREARVAVVKCIDCNAPVVRTIDGAFVCVDCGDSPIRSSGDGRNPTITSQSGRQPS